MVPSNSTGWAESLSFFDKAMEGEFIDSLLACGVAEGDEIMAQTMAPISLVEAVVALGAIPVFVDSEPQTGNMYAEQLRNAIRSRFAETGKMAKAIVPVSMCGKEYNKEYIGKVADRYEIPVVEYPAPAGDEVPMPLHLREEYKGYKAFVNGVAERMWKSA